MTSLLEVELGVLGPLQVRRAGTPVAIPGAKPRAILTLLGLHVGSVVSADTLVELLWGEDPPRTAAKALQTHISSLRRALGDGFVLTEGAGWTLAESEVDASRYKSAARRGRDAAAAGDTGQAVARFEEALELWRGIPELPDGRRGTSEKTRWIEGHAALVEDRADALLATGRAAEIIGELEAAVADAPLRERRWAQLMLALYRAGRQGEALGAYQRARTLLADELGVDPGPELRRLETAIVAQDAALETPGAQNVPAVTRAVTFLLTDIEGSTAAWEADAAAMGVALARHDELVEQVVTSRGGRLIKTRGEGDATFSVFERPSAAAAAALELQDAMLQEPWALREPMRIRVALHTGEAEFRDGDYFGRAVNRAARLRSLAAGGQILCSGATAELVIDSLPDDVALADLGTRQLKNLARPEHVFELRQETAEGRGEEEVSGETPLERPSLPAVLAGPGPFVGRGQELERLFSAWQTALASGTNAVLIAGEPGVGKTRLAGEWSRQAYDQGALVIYGRCDEDLGAPYQPFAEALRSLVPCLGSGRLGGLRGVEALLPLVPGLTDVLPDLAAPTRADPDTERYALFDAVVALLSVASASAPVVLILDDLHWAAKPTLLLLRHLLRFGERARVQIIGTYRSTDLDRSHPLSAMLADLHRDGTANRLQLGGLDEEDVTAYVAEAGYNDEELARALASVTGGNPFFLIEALRHVEESGGRWDQSTLPQGVREAVSRRLSRLTPETNKALAAAAVVGSRFALELVERVVGDDLVDAFDEACKAGIVLEEPGGRYRFNHALVRQSLLAELPSVRRMRLHQRIATTLENEPGADDELLAELAHHYFECAWAGNAVKAVEYCRRAADQAMARLAYEGAADLYGRALHALEEIDDELPDRDDQTAELLVARCEALLAAGDVTSAAAAVSQLQGTTVDSVRLAAWATCFDGQLSMLTDPERLDEVEAAVGAAADKLAELGDAAGEAKAHTVRAGCLARLGRIGDCEVALDDALTAARRAREHRRVNAVLAQAPLAALWGPNPVPRAGGRCLDVVRLLRITTDSPAVEATSTRCQAVLEAFRGRAAAARRMIDSARRTVTELGLRHALLEVEQFAGIVELVVDEPATAEPHLRKAYNGFRRMGLDADTAETAALLGRACLTLGRNAEADELCTESERLAGHALKPSIAWRTLRARLLSRGGDHDEARRVAEAAVSLAERTDALVDHADACLSLATVLGAAGDVAGARAAADQAVGLYERKGAAALAERARGVLGAADLPQPPQPEAAPVQVTNACVQAGSRMIDAVNREAWDEVAQALAPYISVESRRKIVGFARIDVPSSQWPEDMRRYLETGMVRYRQAPLAVRGERLALMRLEMGTTDVSAGAPKDEMLQVVGLDEEGRIALQVKFDVEDTDAALAELDALHARFEEEQPTARRLENAATRAYERVPPVSEALPEVPSAEIDNAAVRVGERVMAAAHRGAWDEVEQLFAPEVSIESRRKVVGLTLPSEEWRRGWRREVETGARISHLMVAARGERLALARMKVDTEDVGPGAPYDELLHLYAIDDDGRVALQMFFDVEDIDAALAELDAAAARFEDDAHRPARRLQNTAARVFEHVWSHFANRDWEAMAEMVADNYSGIDRRRVVNAGIQHGRDSVINDLQAAAEVGFTISMVGAIAIRGERLVLARVRAAGRDPEAISNDALNVVEIDADQRITTTVTFDLEDMDAAVAELEARYRAGEGAPYSRTWSVVTGAFVAHNRRELAAATPDAATIDHRRVAAFAPGEGIDYLRAGWDLGQKLNIYVETVHRLSDLGAVFTWAGYGSSDEGFEAEWRGVNLMTVDGEMVDRREVFDEGDVEAAVARFDQLSRPAPRLENAASRVDGRFQTCFAARDWAAMGEILADDIAADDRRRVVNAGIRRGRDAKIADMRATADLGTTKGSSTVIAIRGERLALVRIRLSGRDQRPDAFQTEMLGIVEVNADNRMTARILFDPDDFNAAIAELDTRYLAGEAAPYAHTWSVVARAYDAANRQQLQLATDCVSIDHRRARAFAPGELTEYMRATWDLAPDVRGHIDAVHRLGKLGAVVTHVVNGSSQEGFDAEWREVFLVALEGDLINRAEIFDEADLQIAIRGFEELHRQPPRSENTASQVAERLLERFAARDWDAIAELLADDFSGEDRRRVVGAGIRHGRDAEIASIRAGYDLGGTNMTSTVIATRGARLILTRTRHSGSNPAPDSFLVDVLAVVEINAENRIAARVVFDLDDTDAACAELDARYLTGEAAAYARTWSTIAGVYAAINRREIAATTADFVSIDHRRGPKFAPGELIAYVRASWDLAQDGRTHIETVHRLNNLGAVVTHVVHGTSQEGFEAEWREVVLLAVDGDLISRSEMFDESDLDAAITRFDQLSRPAPRLENAASQTLEQWLAHFATRDWDAMAALVADDYYGDDRRPVFGAGIQRGGDVMVRQFQTAADMDVTRAASDVVATRGNRVALTHTLFSRIDDGPDAFRVDVLYVVEIDADERISTLIAFDSNQFDAAIQELDARYLAGEAADYTRSWSVIAGFFAAHNRRELPATTPDAVSIDHRRGAAFAPGEGFEYIRAGWDLDQNLNIYIETAHRLDDLGAVFTWTGHGTSREGFDAEWRGVTLMTVEGEMLSRMEVFDEADLDSALARFNQLSRPAPRLENAASQAYDRFRTYFAARDWAAMAELLTADTAVDDHRRVVNAEIRRGRDVEIANMRAFADIGVKTSTATIIATRGERLVLCRTCISSEDHQSGGFRIEMLIIVETSTDERILARVAYDPEDIDTAFAELDARYLTGEAAAHARTWTVVTQAYDALNRRELPATTPDWVNIDHRRGTSFASGDMPALLDAAWNVTTDLTNSIEAVHRLNDLGAVITNASRETSQEGFDAEWRVITVVTVDGDRLNRCEVFDEADLDAAIARFDELTQPAPRLENTATRVWERLYSYIGAGDWHAVAQISAENVSVDDRRRVVNAGILHGRDANIKDAQATVDVGFAMAMVGVLAIRGTRLALTRVRVSGREPEAIQNDALSIVEIDADERIVGVVVFDLDDFDDAIAELDARYLAGEAVAHGRTWSVVAEVYAALNRGEMPAATPDLVDIDHRALSAIGSGDFMAFLRASLEDTEDTPRNRIYIEAVHQLTDLGAVTTHVARSTSREGFEAEWRITSFFIVDGDAINRYEIYDEADIDAAIARFEQLSRPARRLENAATRVNEQIWACFDARDWNRMNVLFADDMRHDDRRRTVGAGVLHGREAQIEDMRVVADIGVSPTIDVIATRGEHLALTRTRFSGIDQEPQAFLVEVLTVIEIDGDDRLAAVVAFDPDDIVAAFEELDARYLAGEAAPYARVWQRALDILGEVNRHEPGPAIERLAFTDHRRIPFADGDFRRAIEDLWPLVPDARYGVTAVHALDAHAVVASLVIEGSDAQGNELQWARTLFFDPDEPRLEIYEESDVDTALARFEQLRPWAPRLENGASQMAQRFLAHFAAHDWDAMAELLTDDVSSDDRRRTVNAGIRRGRDAEMANWRATADIWTTRVESTVVATRGERLALIKVAFTSQDRSSDAFNAVAFAVLEINDDNRIAADVVFDLDDFDAAITELDARYLAGEAAAHLHTWSVIARICAAFNRKELFATTPDPIYIDHRPLVSIEGADLAASIRAVWSLTSKASVYIEAVHQLSERGAVFSEVLNMTSREGFDAEVRMIMLFTVEGDLISGVEVFDEADLDAALARFDELHQQTRRLENAASRVHRRLRGSVAARDWNAVGEILADDIAIDDRRRVENSGIQHGRDAAVVDMRSAVDLGLTDISLTVIATRGDRLELCRTYIRYQEQPEAFRMEFLSVLEINAEERIVARVAFDPDDIDAAFTELDARYLAGEAAAYSHIWSVVAESYSASNRHELPGMRPNSVYIDHRTVLTNEREDLAGYLRSVRDLTPDMSVHIEAVHQLSDLGAVITQVARGSSQEGFDAEWRAIVVGILEGDLYGRVEAFDEDDLDTALARFDELNRPPALENNATRTWSRMADATNHRDMEGFLALTAADLRYEDRRKGLRGQFEGPERRRAVQTMLESLPISVRVSADPIAIRGSRLSLIHIRYRDTDYADRPITVEFLQVAEVDAGGLMRVSVSFDPEDIKAAFEELDTRYLAGEAAAHAHTWSAIMQTCAALNRRELFAMTADFVDVDHRSLAANGSGDLLAYIRQALNDGVYSIYVEAVHRLNDLGAVVTLVSNGTSEGGFDGEWRMTDIFAVEGDLISRCEIFAHTDLDAALERFEELNRPG